jgi:hypothetical protein
MSFVLHPNTWYGWQMLPGYVAQGCLPWYSPIFVRKVQPLKTGKGLLRLNFFHALYAEGVQEFGGFQLQMLDRADAFLAARIVEPTVGHRVAIMSEIGFAWLNRFCPELTRGFPPESFGIPWQDCAGRYLSSVFFQNPPLPDQPDCMDAGSENDWLTHCALRFDGYAWAKANGMDDQPASFCEAFLTRPTLNPGTEHLMTAMFMLQRFLMKEGVRSKTDAGWRALRNLFLQLAAEPVPPEYQTGDWHRKWCENFLPCLRAGKALILRLSNFTSQFSED